MAENYFVKGLVQLVWSRMQKIKKKSQTAVNFFSFSLEGHLVCF